MGGHYGTRGRDFCLEDLHHHCEYLQACLKSACRRPFREYARWLASILRGRGMTDGHLAESFMLLADKWSLQLRPGDRGAVAEVFQVGVEALAETDRYQPSYYRHLPPALPASTTLTEALVAGNRPAAREVVFAGLHGGTALVDVCVSVVQPSMYEIGRRWQESQVSIAQEHLATAITQTLLAQAFVVAEFQAPVDRKALFACVEGNHHALGARMVSDAFEVAGWEVQLLGADTPSRSLLRQVDLFAQLLGLSVSLPQQVLTLKKTIQQLSGEMGSRCPTIMVGGLALNQLEDLWRGVDADVWTADAKKALSEVR